MWVFTSRHRPLQVVGLQTATSPSRNPGPFGRLLLPMDFQLYSLGFNQALASSLAEHSRPASMHTVTLRSASHLWVSNTNHFTQSRIIHLRDVPDNKPARPQSLHCVLLPESA